MILSLADIESAQKRIRGVVVETPLLQSAVLNERVGASVFIKPENLQHIGAFKFRGAYNRLSQLSTQQREKGVVAFSSGNHAQGIAYAAKLLDMKATIVMPADAPAIKLQGTKDLGAEIVLYDRRKESREAIAASVSQESGATLVPAYDDVQVMAGQGTCGLELVQQLSLLERSVDFVLVPCGGGGLLAGVSTAVKGLTPGCAVYGVEPENYDDHYRSWKAGKRISVPIDTQSLCDALMAPAPGELTWSVNSNTVDGYLRVCEDDVAYAVSFAFRYLKLVIESGAAVPLAALLRNKLESVASIANKTVAIVLSGGNIDPATLKQCLDAYPSP